MKYIVVIFICTIALTGCGTKVIVKDSATLNEASNVSMTIKNGTLTRTGATVIITDLNEMPYQYSNPFLIEVKENGEWKEVKKINEGNFNLPLYSVSEDNKIEFKENWESIYGKLKKGEYRLVKYVFNNKDEIITAESQKLYFSVEFIIK